MPFESSVITLDFHLQKVKEKSKRLNLLEQPFKRIDIIEFLEIPFFSVPPNMLKTYSFEWLVVSGLKVQHTIKLPKKVQHMKTIRINIEKI